MYIVVSCLVSFLKLFSYLTFENLQRRARTRLRLGGCLRSILHSYFAA